MVETDIKERLKLIKTHSLPPQTKAFVALIGLAETIKLLQARGGSPLYIPKLSDKTRTLPEILQPDSIKKLATSAMAGHIIDLPKADKLLQQLRNLDIISQRGIKSRRELAKEFNLTTRHIQGIWSEDPIEKEEAQKTQPAQKHLF